MSDTRESADDDRPLIGLVGCVKMKREHSAAAQDLYISPLFKGRRRAVEARTSRWFVLSAKYGLVRPDQTIEPYDRALTDLPPDARRDWSFKVFDSLRTELGDLNEYRFEIHAGHAYFGYGLEGALTAAHAGVSIPTRGLAQGRQLRFYAGQSPSEYERSRPSPRRRDSPYQAIAELADAAGGTSLRLTLDRIEEAIDRQLPRSARRFSAWWFGSAAHRPPWIEAGWWPRPRLQDGFVEFVKRADTPE